jgi:hypothetical protein
MLITEILMLTSQIYFLKVHKLIIYIAWVNYQTNHN